MEQSGPETPRQCAPPPPRAAPPSTESAAADGYLETQRTLCESQPQNPFIRFPNPLKIKQKRSRVVRCFNPFSGLKESKRSLTDVIQRSGAELSVEGLGSEPAEVTNGEGPQVEHVVSGERLPLLHHHHLSPQEGQLDGCSEPTRPCAQNQTLGEEKGNGNQYRRHREQKKKVFYSSSSFTSDFITLCIYFCKRHVINCVPPCKLILDFIHNIKNPATKHEDIIPVGVTRA